MTVQEAKEIKTYMKALIKLATRSFKKLLEVGYDATRSETGA